MHTLGSKSGSRAGGEANPCCGLSGAHGSSEPGVALQSFSKLKQGGQCLPYPCTSQPLTTSPGRDITLGEAVPLRAAALYLSTNIPSARGSCTGPEKGIGGAPHYPPLCVSFQSPFHKFTHLHIDPWFFVVLLCAF